MSYDEEQDEQEEEQEEEEQSDEDEVTCTICEYDVAESDIVISFTEKESENDTDICNACWKQIVKKAQSKGLLPTGETKVVEKIVEKPVERIVYKTIDKNGNEVGNSSNNKTKFDCV